MPRTLKESVKVNRLPSLSESGADVKDHLLCLNRSTANTGPEWFERTLLQLDASLLSAQNDDNGIKPDNDRRIPLHIWWGWQDGMVPRKGQRESLATCLHFTSEAWLKHSSVAEQYT
jgi:hypothetical protein